MGLMECVAKAAHDGGGQTVGVIPTIIEKGGKVSEHVDVRILCDNLSDRKDLLIGRSDVIIALPGGVGTLDEVFTVLAAASIGYHHKQVILYNIDGFWDSLLDMLADLRRRGALRDGFDDTLKTARCLDDIKRLCSPERLWLRRPLRCTLCRNCPLLCRELSSEPAHSGRIRGCFRAAQGLP